MPPSQAPPLKHRMCTPADVPQLIALRRKCGWGWEYLEEHGLNPDEPLCILVAEIDGRDTDIGMLGWAFQQSDARSASRERGRVALKAFYIDSDYQMRGFGTAAMRLWEDISVSQFGAKVFVLDTAAYRNGPSEDGTHRWQDLSEPQRIISFYKKLGYKILGAPEKVYRDPLSGSPEPAIWAVFLEKAAQP